MSTNTTTPVMGSDLVAAIESFWSAIVERHPELPAHVIVVTGSGSGKRRMTRGHWARDRWTVGEGRAPELFIAGERIAEGAVLVAQTIIHEAAHGLLLARGDDTAGTSRGGSYHNGRFVKAATELGLAKPAETDSVIGWSDCPIRPETIEAYRTEIDALAAALTGSIGSGTAGAVKPRAKRAKRTYRKAVTLACECREVKLPADQADELEDIDCHRCGATFVRQ
jgi:hypothetical protein